ncbi:MAG: carboxypeptidase regulatory-like domain-containing protein [Bryobacteraceae bacterium]
MKHLRLMCALLCLVLAFSPAAYSQAVSATLVGTVTDASGAAMANTKITATEVNTGINRTAPTNESGNYTFADLPPGTYTVTAEQAGFKRASRAGIDVIVNTSVRIDLVLQPGEVTETVNVTAEAPALQTERADTGRKIEAQVLENLTLGGNRNFQNLSILVPGAAKVESQHSAFFNPQVSLATRFNGQSRLGNNLELEGVDDNERTGLLQVLIPPLEAIQTVDISTSDYDAEIGRATGGAINVILKSGSNQIHGSAYEFNRLSALSARNFFDAARGHFTYNYFGGTVGGPIIKNRTFFFGDYLRIEDHSSNNDRLTVPTAAERIGNLSVATQPIYDPNTGNQATGAGRSQFIGNQIPLDRINPVSAKILSIIPLPNLPGLTQNYFVNSPFYRNTDQFDVKVDHNQSDKDRFSVRYSFSRPVSFDASVYGIYGGPRGTGGNGFEGTGVQGTHSGAINYNRIFSPTLITEARFGVNRYRNDAQQVGYGMNTADALGIPGINGIPWTSGPPQIALDTFGDPFIGFSASLPWIRAESNVLFVNTWTKTKGNHTFKWGIDLRRLRDDLLQTQTFNPRGRIHFGVSQTSVPGALTSFGNSFASFLLDVPSDEGRDYPVAFPAYRAWQFFAFAQDKWVVTPKLTLDLGLRWEFYPPATPAHTAGFSQYNPTNNTLVIAGVGGNPSDLGLDRHYKDFGPRLGAAYRLNEKTVIRTGFGISYAPFPDNTYAYNYPVKQNNTFSGNCTFCPAVLPNGQPATFQAGFPPFAAAVIPSNGIVTNTDPNSTYFVVNPHFREPYVESWNFAIQRTLPWNLVLDVAYVGNHGVDQPAVFNLNASTTLGADIQGQPEFAAFGRKASTELRYVGYSSAYHSLQSKLDHRFSSGFSLTTAYTYSKALGYQSEDSGLEFYINPRRNWQRLNFDRKHFFVQSYVYDLPFGKGRHHLESGPGAWVLGGWQVSGILTISSGAPLGNNGGTIAFPAPSAGLKAPGNQNTVNHFGPLKILYGDGKDKTWFDTTICSATVTTGCFSQPPAGQFGNLGPNFIDGPGYWDLGATLFRNFQLTERFKLQIRGEGFSIVNTPQWNQPNTDITNASFGHITTATGNRSIQLAAKLTF